MKKTNNVSGIFLAHLPDFVKEMVWFKKAETEDLVKGLISYLLSFSYWLMSKDNPSQHNNNNASIAMITFRQWLVFLQRHNLISQDHCGMLSHGMLSFSNENCMLHYSNNWTLFLNFIIYWLWGYTWKPITSSRVSSAPCLLHFVQY